MALVEYAQRHNRLQDLTQVMQRARPQLDLGGFEDPK